MGGDFQVISSSASWLKQVCVFLRNKYGYQIGNTLEKNKLCFDQGRNAQNGLILHTCSYKRMISLVTEHLTEHRQAFINIS